MRSAALVAVSLSMLAKRGYQSSQSASQQISREQQDPRKSLKGLPSWHQTTCRVEKTGLFADRGFGKPCLPAKNWGVEENGEDDEFSFYPQKQRLLLRKWEVTRAKAWFTKSMFFSSLIHCTNLVHYTPPN